MAEDNKPENEISGVVEVSDTESANTDAAGTAPQNGAEESSAEVGEKKPDKKKKDKKQKKDGTAEGTEQTAVSTRGLISNYKPDRKRRKKIFLSVLIFFFVSIMIIGLAIVLAEIIADKEIPHSEQEEVVDVSKITIYSGLSDSYLVGSKIDLTLVRLKVYYTDGKTEIINATTSMIIAPVTDEDGIFDAKLVDASEDVRKYEVRFSYRGSECTKEITVVRHW